MGTPQKIPAFLSILLIAAGCSDTSDITNNDDNTAPTVSTANLNQDAVVGFDFQYDATQSNDTFLDADNDTLTYSVTYAPDNGDFTAANGVISGTPSTTDTVVVTITASDGQGGTASNSFTIDVTADQAAVLAAFGGVIDLENLDNYADPTIPNYITKLEDGGNPVTDAGATLGRVLFYDVQLSIDDTVACASCHIQSHGFSDPNTVSNGVQGGVTGRHSMRLINTQYADETDFFWDERADSHEEQESQPLQDHNEHGFSGQAGRPDLDDLFDKIESIEYYQELFRFVFHDEEVTEARLQIALAQFVKSIHSFDSRYDVGRAQVNDDDDDFPNFTADENEGKELFMSNMGGNGPNCDSCHRPPEFDIAPNSDQNGVVGVAGDPTGSDLTNTRSPTLRDLVDPDGNSNGPFMHDGSLTTLADVIDHYDDIDIPATVDVSDFLDTLDNRLQQGGNPQSLGLTNTEKDQIVQFLETLSGSNVYTDEKWSDPF